MCNTLRRGRTTVPELLSYQKGCRLVPLQEESCGGSRLTDRIQHPDTPWPRPIEVTPVLIRHVAVPAVLTVLGPM